MNAADALPGRCVAVVGAGAMGRRIALMFAARGGVVRVCDRSEPQRVAAAAFVEENLPAVLAAFGDGAAGAIEFRDELGGVVLDAWLVVESLPERLDVKQAIFGELDRVAPIDAILATNSSSYPSSRLIEQVSRPERVLNMHFFMPPQVAAVELMSCGHTDPAVIERLMQLLPEYGLTPFRVQRESMGFIYNRIWAAIKHEALTVAADGVAQPADIDRLFTMVLRTPLGPFQMMDSVGLDVVLDIENSYAAERPGWSDAPRELLQRYIDDGRLGKKSGRGFYDYREPGSR